MPRFDFWTIATLATLTLAGCTTAATQMDNKITLSVGVTKDFEPVMRQLAQEYHYQQPWVDIQLHVATNTAKLEQDLKDGVAYDIFIPARAESMMAIIKNDIIIPKSTVWLAENQLVVVARADTTLPLNLSSLTNPDVRQIAVADPNGLLLGFLTRESLTNMGLIPSHEAKPLVDSTDSTTPPATNAASAPPNLEPKLLVVPDEASVLTAVEDGRAQIGIEYALYALADKKIRVLSPMPLNPPTYDVIQYVAAIPRNAPHPDEAGRFLNFLRSTQAHDMMQRNGLLTN